jgi:amino acid transporter
MLNKYNAALIATLVFGVIFPLSFVVFTGEHPAPRMVAITAVLFFFSMLALFGRILRKNTPGQR